VKEGCDANNLDATQKWSIANTNEFLSKYAEGVISFQWSPCGLYKSIRISSRIWWVMLTIHVGDAPALNGETDVHSWFRLVRVVEWILGHNVLICDCVYFCQVGLSCRHLFHVKGVICLTYCDIHWYKSYNYHDGWIPRYTHNISHIINRVKEVGVPFCVASLPTITDPVYTNCTDSFYFDWAMKAPTPVMMDDCFPDRLDDNSDKEFDYEFIDDGEMTGEYYSLFVPQQSTTEYVAAIQLAIMPQTINHPYRFHLEA
jgi:hypothetical protein